MRRAVVSGGGTGIGKAVARRLARDGDDVVIIGRRRAVLEDAAKEINSEAGAERVAVATADLTAPAEVEAVAADLTRDGGIDVVVNNAGGNPARTPPGDLAAVADAYVRTFQLNVVTAVMLTEALLPHIKRPGGRIVSVSSIAALRGAGPYGAAKSAMHGWSMGLAQQVAPEGITVNVVAPGFVPETGFWEDILTPELEADRLAGIPAGRAGTPEEVAAAIAHLASPDAGWTTGQILQINGGTLLGRG